MTDAPQHVHELQLKLWLSKTPGERLLRFLKDNDDMLKALIETKKKLNIHTEFISAEQASFKNWQGGNRLRGERLIKVKKSETNIPFGIMYD
jgi:hypothetical protein